MNEVTKMRERQDKLWDYMRTFPVDKTWKPLNRTIEDGGFSQKDMKTYLNFKKVNASEFLMPVDIDTFMIENEITDKIIGYSSVQHSIR